MARDFAAGEPIVVCLGDNIFEHSHAAEIGAWGAAPQFLSRTCPTPGTSASSRTATTARSPTSSRRPDASTSATTPAVERRGGRSLLLPAGRVRDHRQSQPSSRGELEITDVNRVYAERGELELHRVEGWWHDGGKHWADLADVGRLIEQTGVNSRSSTGSCASRCSGSRTTAGGSTKCAVRARFRTRRCRRTSRFAQGDDSRPALHERGQDDLFACLRARRAWSCSTGRPAPRSRRTSATTTRSRSTFPASTRTASRRSPISCSVTT